MGAITPLAMYGVGQGLKLLGGIFGSRRAKRKEREAAKLEAERRREMNRLKQVYSSISTTNPFLNMENTFEDVTINQRQAEFESQQFAQSQANILSGLRQAAGSSGIAALAQSLAQQGQLRAQQASASIGTQESRLQELRAREEGRLQQLERRGEIISRGQQRDLAGTMLGMAQQETAAARQERMGYEQQRQAYTSSIFNTLGSSVSGLGDFEQFGGTK